MSLLNSYLHWLHAGAKGVTCNLFHCRREANRSHTVVLSVLYCLSSPVCQSPLSGSMTAVLLLALCSTSSCARTIPCHPDTGGWTIWMFTHCQVKTNWVLIIINNYYYISIKILYQLWWVINLMLFFLWVPCQSWTLRTLRKSRPPRVTSIKWTTNYNEPFSALLLMLWLPLSSMLPVNSPVAR